MATRNQLNTLRIFAAPGGRWTMTMTDALLKSARELRKLGLVEFIDRAPDRRGNGRGADVVATMTGRIAD